MIGAQKNMMKQHGSFRRSLIRFMNTDFNEGNCKILGENLSRVIMYQIEHPRKIYDFLMEELPFRCYKNVDR